MLDKLKRFMWGRYGNDQLNVAMVVTAMIFSLLGGIFDTFILQLPSYILIILVFFRMLSKNIAARRNENAGFMKYWTPIGKWFKLQDNKLRDIKTHRYFTCPTCKNTLRVPKGRGMITITCPVCKRRFDKKT